MDETALQRLEDLTDHTGPSAQDYPLNGWWVAATANEVSEKPLSRMILGTRLVLFRPSDGRPYAFTDRCAHRWAPLSRGKVIQDEIVCPYHGFRYNLKGECTLVPTLPRPPQALRVRSYPTMQHGPFVWVWMGESAKADPALLPTITWQRHPNEVRISGYRMTHCEFSLIHENIADTEHTKYLHGESTGNSARIGARSRVHGAMDVEPPRITFLSTATKMPPSKLDIAVLGLEANQDVDQSVSAEFTGPGCFTAEIEWARSARKQGALNGLKALYLWCSTPISANTCHFWWDLTFDPTVHNQQVVEELWTKAIEEDIDIVEGVQSSVDSISGGGNATDALVAADRPVAAIRRLLKSMAKGSAAG